MSRFASLSVDLDNHWSYLKTHGEATWMGFPTYLDTVVPRVLEFADEIELTLTVFIVGQDAELGKNAAAMALLGDSRHEVGNHSFHHEPWLHLKSEGEVEEEIGRAGRAIEGATGRTPLGFRGPGFSISQATMRALDRNGYRYDASTLPTFIGPLARAFYMKQSGLDREEMARRNQLFGTWREVLRPINPYRWAFDDMDSDLVEVPVTTMPLLRLPIHGTYLLYLARISPTLSNAYLRTALMLCRLTGVRPSILLHSLDFVGAGEVRDLGFFPGMDMLGEEKRRLLSGYCRLLTDFGEVVTVGEHAARAARTATKIQAVASLA